MHKSLDDEMAELLAAYAGRERIPLRELGERIGMDPSARSRAVRAGVIRPAGRAGLGGGYYVGEDEARRLIIAWRRAVAVGVGVVTVLRVLGR